jgi:hypothetical protein
MNMNDKQFDQLISGDKKPKNLLGKNGLLK